jgi:tetratricopeptide (TPR) repeat protein
MVRESIKMGRNLDLTIEELLQREDDWSEREDFSNISWIREGIKLYQLFLRKDPTNLRYSEMLGYLLLKQGEDENLRHHSYQRAIFAFERVVKLDRANAIAFYRLGLLYFYQEKWAKSIHSFQQALQLNPPFSRYRLNKEQKIKALYYILTSSNIIMNETLEQVQKIPDLELNIFREMKILLEELNREPDKDYIERPYQMILNGKKVAYLTYKEYEEYSDPDKNQDIVIIDQQDINNTYISLYRKQIRLNGNQVPILDIILRHPDGISKRDLMETKFFETVNPENSLYQEIRRLRMKLAELNQDLDFVIPIDGGYKWNWDKEYRMFKYRRDITSDLLLV